MDTESTREPALGERPKAFRDRSPEEVRKASREAVAKGMGAVVGATEGFVEHTKPHAMAEAARVTAQTIRSATDATREEYQLTRDELGLREDAPASETWPPSVGEAGESGRARQGAERAVERGREASKRMVDTGREYMRTHSPQEIREGSREGVGRALAAATGAAEGWVDQANPGSAGEAVHKLGEVVRESGKAMKEEMSARKPPE